MMMMMMMMMVMMTIILNIISSNRKSNDNQPFHTRTHTRKTQACLKEKPKNNTPREIRTKTPFHGVFNHS